MALCAGSLIRRALGCALALAVPLMFGCGGGGGGGSNNNNNNTVAAPTLTAQPAAATVTVGQSATFSVAATGSGTLTFQWQVSPDGTAWSNVSAGSGGTTATYTTAATVLTDNGSQFRAQVSNAGGTTSSAAAILTVNPAAPAIQTQPASATVTVGQSATFTVTATGSGTLSYQWQRSPDGSAWSNVSSGSGGTTASYTTAATVLADNGAQFRVQVSNAGGTTSSAAATLTVTSTPPVLTLQPASLTVALGQTATFTAAATGTGTLTFAWQVAHPGGSWTTAQQDTGGPADSYVTPATTATDNGDLIRVQISSASGSVTSAAATLTVAPAPDAGAAFAPGPALNVARLNHQAVNGADGSILVVGGHGTGFTALASAERWDPASNTFTLLTMTAHHDGGAVVTLANGQLLIAGGAFDSGVAPGNAYAELYNPVDHSFKATGNLTRARMNCTGATLGDGRALLVGGWYDSGSTTYGELYNPAAGTFTATGALNFPRAIPLVLPTTDGNAVVFGGYGAFGLPAVEAVELFNAASGTFSVLQNALLPGETGWVVTSWNYMAPLDHQRLPDGRYLLMAGRADGSQQTLFTFDPGSKVFARFSTPHATAQNLWLGRPVIDPTHGQALILAAVASAVPEQICLYRINLADGSQAWPGTATTLPASDYVAYASLSLANGSQLFVTGGSSTNDASINFNPIASTLLATPVLQGFSLQPVGTTVAAGQPAVFSASVPGATPTYQWQRSNDGGTTWNPVSGATTAIYRTPATVASDSGARFRVLVGSGGATLTSAAATLTVAATASAGAVFTAGPNMNTARMNHMGVNLPDGGILLVGGHGNGFVSLASAERWDPSSNTFSPLTMNATHDFASVAWLANGKLLIADGAANLGVAPGFATAELFNPADRSFTVTGSLVYPRMNATATPLADGKVLVAGGWYDANSSAYAERYDPVAATFSATGKLNTPRAVPILLPTPDGRAVLFGGYGVYGTPLFEQVELFNPADGSFSILQGTLFPGESGWMINGINDMAPFDAQRLADGRYLLLATNQTTSQQVLFTFDPWALQFAKFGAINPGDQVTWINRPVLDTPHGVAYLLTEVNNSSPVQLAVTTVDLATGATICPGSGYALPASTWPASSGLDLTGAGQLLITGGSSANDVTVNFHPIAGTWLATPTLAP